MLCFYAALFFIAADGFFLFIHSLIEPSDNIPFDKDFIAFNHTQALKVMVFSVADLFVGCMDLESALAVFMWSFFCRFFCALLSTEHKGQDV